MFIKIKHGENNTLICNPNCHINNMFDFILNKISNEKESNFILDLADENGNIQDLDNHREEYANNFLESGKTYILLKKIQNDNNSNQYNNQTILKSQDELSPENEINIQYIALLNNIQSLYPSFKLKMQKQIKQEIANQRSIIKTKSKSPKTTTSKNTQSMKKKQ